MQTTKWISCLFFKVQLFGLCEPSLGSKEHRMGLPGSSQVRLDVWQRAELRRLHVYLAHSKAAFYSQPNVTVNRNQQKSPCRSHQTQQQQQAKVESSASLLDGYLREADAVRAELAAWAEVEGRGPSRIAKASPGDVNFEEGSEQPQSEGTSFPAYVDTDQASPSAIESEQVLEACLAIAEKYFNLGFTAGVRFCHGAMQSDSRESNSVSESASSEIVTDSWEDDNFDARSSSSTTSRHTPEADAIAAGRTKEDLLSEDRLKCEAWPLLHGTAACSGDSARARIAQDNSLAWWQFADTVKERRT
ncbi:hypothetical protein BIW11_03597 [Tropilaelaps mercedesae]|uniref:Uncharacterized protein n=1 Tax=Tropilaelaps mercedesae TaxID=418985 RepID=A0A1V9XJ18_9ACAR|nr:hypothetical protein BIW11_03597 [Tropilaelaps mercedesae]